MKLFSDVGIIFRIYLTKMRGELGGYLLTSLIFPVGLFVLLSITSGAAGNKEQLLSGSIVFSVSMVSIMWVGFHLLEDKFHGRLKLFITLPVAPLSYLLGIICFAALQAAMGVAGLLIIGLLLGVELRFSLLLVPLLLLGMLSLTSVAIIIARYAKSMTQGELITDGLGAALVFISPVYYSISQMPHGLRFMAYLLPPTYIADALRKLLSGNNHIATDMAALLVLAVLSLSISVKLTRWREE